MGLWQVEPETNRVDNGAEAVQLEPRVMDVLLFLIEHAGEVCSKEQIIRDVWTDTFVTDEALWHCISQLRKVFSDDARDPSYIETVYKRGYRLVAQVDTVPAPAQPRPTRPPWESRPITVGFLLLAAVAWGVYLQPFGTDSQASDRLVTTPLTSSTGQEIDPAISPDGRQLAFAWDLGTDDGFDIYVQLVGQNEPFRLTDHPAMEHRPAWSPDGASVAFVRNSSVTEEKGIYVVGVLGGAERKVAGAELGHIFNLTWSPAGDWLAVASTLDSAYQYRISLVSPTTGQVRTLTDPAVGIIGDRDPAFSPDGRTIAFRRSVLRSSDDLYWIRVDGSEAGRLTYDYAEILGLSWHRQSILFSSSRVMPRSLWRVAFPSGRLDWLPMGEEFAVDPAVSSQTGRLVYQRMTCDANIWALQLSDPDVSRFAPFITSTRVEHSPQYSPDGRHIAFVSNRSGTSEVWLVERSGRRERRLTALNGPGINGLRWAPDSRRIIFNVESGGQADLYVLDIEAGAPRRITNTDYAEVLPSWSADGDWVYFGSNANGDWQIWRLRVSDLTTEQVTTHGGYVALAAADGKHLYYVKRGERGIFRRRLGGQDEELVIEDVLPLDNLNWTISERALYFVKGSKLEGRTLTMLEFETGAQTPLLEDMASSMYPGLSVSPDGRSVLVVRVDDVASDIMLAENFR